MKKPENVIVSLAVICAGAEAASYIANADNLSKTGRSILLPSYVSYSIEFSSFPDFAGNLSRPNDFSNNLLNNIGNYTGTKPIIRVGGNTQDDR